MSDRTKEEIVEEINAIVEKNIQPSVAMHGGIVLGVPVAQ
jgi:Fe-S cluster biogenesis protein NfuA